MLRPRLRGLALAALILALPGSFARAQTPPTGTGSGTGQDDASVAEARRRYAQGREFYSRGRFAEAVAEFTEAYARWQNPTILYALAQAYEGLSEVNRAIETYQRYLDTAPADDVRRNEVTLKLAELERLLATVHIQCNVLASVYIDGEQSGDAPGDLRIATGRHEIELRAEGFESQSQTFTVAGGTERTITFHLEPVPISSTTQVVRVERERFRFPRPVFYTAAGLTGVGLVTWGSLATASIVRANRYNEDPASTNFDRADARRVARNSNIALGVTGGLAGITALVGVLTNWHPDDDEEPAGGAASLTADVQPVVGGAVISARWTR